MLPRRLAPVLPSTYSPSCLSLAKRPSALANDHSESPYHAFAHCKGFAPAASRRTRALISVPFSGLHLPMPLQIIGFGEPLPHQQPNLPQSHPIAVMLQFATFWMIEHSSICHLSGIPLSFPRLSPSIGQVNYVLLSRMLSSQVTGLTCMA